ncbi:2-hydroxy-6-oxohepta-2,4-dienoate hydrolase (TodF) [uncultured Desulfobacterium sp.]|uniref:2-hydroxy-6-oxohepta-2,4-dienoate hydrolase (TodF) n=1 Tax=uncultured Desulfobacterium sp. TaxID=201089 RepID=A0A445MVV8_9BACT|nr:2-hydroxy-6-oxohepta-2,4-dienoate hydrolase (TodF) [uncultured Desulfobacterium sp.]
MIKKDITLNVDGIAINGQLFIPGQIHPYPTVCLCHGIPAGDRPEPNDGGYPLLAENICRQGLNVFIFNFRGTGISGGNIDLLGWTKDLAAVIDHLYLLPEVDKSHIAVLGFSGGAAVSICVAARDNRINYLAACACPAEFYRLTEADDAASWIDHFRKIGAIRDDNFPRSTEEWLDGFRFVSPVEYVSQIAPRPLLLIHAKDDETVSISHAHRLYERAREPKQLVVLDAAGHKLRRDQRVLTEFIRWLVSHLQGHKALVFNRL